MPIDPVVNKMYAFNLPSPYQAEMAKIADQRRMAEMLQAQSQAPTERFSYKGIEARTPFTAGLAKALQGFGGAYFQRQAREEEKALGERYRGEQMGDMSELISGLNAPAVAGSAAIPEQLAGRPFISADEEGNQMPDVSAAPAIPAVAARMRGQIDPSMMGRMKTPEGANQVLALVMAQRQAQIDAERRANEPYNLTGDQTRFQPMGAGMPPMVVASGVRKDDYGTTPTVVKDSSSPTGFSGFVMNSRGEIKNIGPIDPVNQYTMGTVDAALKRDMDMYQFGNLSADQRASLAIRLTQAGVDVAKLNYETGQAPTPQPGLPANAPAPNFGAQTLPKPGMAPVPAPGTGPRAPGVGQAAPGAAKAILEGELSDARNRLAQAITKGDTANADRLRVDIQSLQRELGIKALPPKVQDEIAKEAVAIEAKRAFNMSGLGSTIDEARNILTGGAGAAPTGSYIGAGVDMLGQVVGFAPSGSAQADRLKSIAGVLTAKMPRMEGPQSDKDVMLYREMAGQIGDNTMPISRRLAALETVEGLWRKYDKSSPVAPPGRSVSGKIGGGGGATGGWSIKPVGE